MSRAAPVYGRKPDEVLQTAFRALQVEIYPNKSVGAGGVAARARSPDALFLHGQFNPRLWLALLNGGLRRKQVFWHVWGADLYEESRSLKFRLFYLLRRLAGQSVTSVRHAWRYQPLSAASSPRPGLAALFPDAHAFNDAGASAPRAL